MRGARRAKRRFTYMLEAPLRRRRLVLVPVLALGIGAAAVAQLLPPSYRAAAMIRADWEASVAAEMERRGLALAERREQAVRQRVAERELLERVLGEASPYGAPDPPGTPPDAQVDRLLADLRIRPMSASAFVIEFAHSNPATAAQVPNLVARELAPDPGTPSEGSRAELEARVAEARRLLQEKSDALARFGAGPRASGDAGAPTDVRAVEASLAAARAREKRLLEETRAGSRTPAEAELERLRGELAALRQRYTEEHPDVEKLRLRIQRLESTSGDSTTRAQLSATQAEIAGLEKRRSELGSRRTDVAARARASAERDEALRTYQARLEELQALVAGRGSRGPHLRFERLRDAAVPERRESPSGPLFLLGGVFTGLAIGLLAALVAEHRDQSVKGPEDLNDILPAPILATVPLVRSRRFWKPRADRAD